MRTKVSDEPLLTLKQLAERLQVGPMWVWKRTSPKGTLGVIPHLKCGRLLRFRWSEILAWLDESRRA